MKGKVGSAEARRGVGEVQREYKELQEIRERCKERIGTEGVQRGAED